MKWQLKWEDGLLAAGAGLLVVGLGATIRQSQVTKVETEVIRKPSPEVKSVVQVNSKVVIDIAGEVVRPGMYNLTNDKRIGDLLVECGGLSAQADRDWVEININRAEKLRDGMKIYIPRKNEVTPKKENPPSLIPSLRRTGKININTAALEELDKLDGVGPSIGQKIIDYREENQGFRAVEEIKLVPGVGDKMYEKIKEEIEI